MANKHPVVRVHGLFGWGPTELGGVPYWGYAADVPSNLKRHFASVGPLSSAHDRACELAAQIKGTQVDYGLEHAKQEGHKRFGKVYSRKSAFVPDWSQKKPVHLVGHSLGSPTVRCLQYLLAIDYWGWGSNAQWVASITTISGVSNGSTGLYKLGADEKTGLLPPASLAGALFGIIQLASGATRGAFDSIYDFDLAHWGFVRGKKEAMDAYLHRVADSQFLRGKDNANYSLTLQGAYADNQVWETDPNTHYFSYVTEQTMRLPLIGYHFPSLLMNLALRPVSNYIGKKKFIKKPIPVANFKSSDWWENDGLVPTYSQLYPRISGHHPVGGEMTADTPNNSFEKGKWYYQWERGFDHLDVCVTPQFNQHCRQWHFYAALFDRLAAL